MKEATGELSTTVIAVVAIAAISALFMVFLYPQLKANIILNQACSNGPGYDFVSDGGTYRVSCPGTTGAGGGTTTYTCYYQVAGAGGGLTGGTAQVLSGEGVRQKTCNQN